MRRSTVVLGIGLSLLAFALAPVRAGATGGTCAGGANDGGACVTGADCNNLCIGGSGLPGCTVDADCGPACASGPDQGKLCATDTDCLDACIGGIVDGNPCLSDLSCFGICGEAGFACRPELDDCTSTGTCEGGSNDGGSCQVFGGVTYYCDGGVCDLGAVACEGTGTCGNTGLCQATGTCEIAACAPNGSNVCFLDTLGEYRDILIVLAGIADSLVAPGDPITLTSTEATLTVPEELILEAYRSFAIGTGVSFLNADFDVEILAENSVEGSQLRLGSDSGSTTVTDPDTDRNNGNESATPVVLTAALANTSWTASVQALDVVFTQGAVQAAVTVGFVNAGFACQPGIAGMPPTTFSPVAPTPFAITDVFAPPTAPVSAFDNADVTAFGTVDIDILANDFDVNADIDPATVEVTVGPFQGEILLDTSTGVIRYFNTDPTPGTDVLLYRVSDETGLTGGTVSVGIHIASPIPALPLIALPVLALALVAAGGLARRRWRVRR